MRSRQSQATIHQVANGINAPDTCQVITFEDPVGNLQGSILLSKSDQAAILALWHPYSVLLKANSGAWKRPVRIMMRFSCSFQINSL